jgi:tetratricopeptide (TPR) repeat protein
MTRRACPLALLLPALALVAAAPPPAPPDELVRQGNDALGRKQYAGALQLYGRAEERTTDPGLVAFNEGVALYEQGDYGRAEAHFRLARQDATGRRRLWACYDLASSLVQTAGDRDVAKLAEAVSLFETCLHDEGADERLAADARHNLELAKLLWLQAKARKDAAKENPPKDDDAHKPPPPRPEPNRQPGADDGSAGPRGNGDRQRGTQEKGQDPTRADGQPAPGEGTLPVIPDRDELVPMSREDAEAHLRQAIERVTREGRAHRQRAPRAPSSKVRDW